MKQTLLLVFLLFLLCPAGIGAVGEPTGVFTDPPEERILIYPNPAVDYISLSGPIADVSEMVIYNMVGRAVLRFPDVSDDRYDVGDLPNGMYLVQLLNHRGKILYTHRMNKRS